MIIDFHQKSCPCFTSKCILTHHLNHSVKNLQISPNRTTKSQILHWLLHFIKFSPIHVLVHRTTDYYLALWRSYRAPSLYFYAVCAGRSLGVIGKRSGQCSSSLRRPNLNITTRPVNLQEPIFFSLPGAVKSSLFLFADGGRSRKDSLKVYMLSWFLLIGRFLYSFFQTIYNKYFKPIFSVSSYCFNNTLVKIE